MPMSWDNEVMEAAISLASEYADGIPELIRGDWRALRQFGDSNAGALDGRLPEHSGISRRDFIIPSYDGADILLRWYTDPRGTNQNESGPAALYMHGGGMIMGSVDGSDRSVAGYVAESGTPLLAVEYRLAPEHPHPTPVEDCWAALSWLRREASSLDVDPDRIAVMGESAGGGLAAAVALLARDRNVPLSRQILIYPMLDDRTIAADTVLKDFAVWTYDNNYTGWHALLGDAIATPEVPAYAAPARATEFFGLADAYIEVGELDIFREECVGYGAHLMGAGSSVELHVHPGCPHGFDRVARKARVTMRARADRIRTLQNL
jgi:acetyl esterase/lipase